MDFGLADNTINEINSIFIQFPDVVEVIIYGSRAKGNFRHGSDIDLVVKGDLLDVETVNKIRWMLDDLLLPYSIDLSILNHINNTDLLNHISRVGLSFYKSEPN